MDAQKTTDKSMSLRDRNIVMDAKRLGVMHQNRISFSRSLIRRMSRENWQLACQRWCLNELGYGHVIYRLATVENTYHLVVFCDEIADQERNDRVIAEKWDVTFALVIGEVDDQLLALLRDNVPMQEAGRYKNCVLVLGRANKSVRVFDSLVSSLAHGAQPAAEMLTETGYVLRTTAVYGNGKFGIADFKALEKNSDFRYSFSAQMCSVYLLREFSLDWINFLAKQAGGREAVTLNKELARYLGIGNATGLGMAPYLINHPCVVDQWMTSREKALSRTLSRSPDKNVRGRFYQLIERASQHFKQIRTINTAQESANHQTIVELKVIIEHSRDGSRHNKTWLDTFEYFADYSAQTQEVALSCLMELYPESVDEFEVLMNAQEALTIDANYSIGELKKLIDEKYRWAIDDDYSQTENTYWFWYRSQDKEEPRLGVRGLEEGEDRELTLDIGRQVNQLYHQVCAYDSQSSIAQFLLHFPQYRTIARRVWTMAHRAMGDIQVNILRKDALPIDLLRCKLAMLGATKFDPRSDRWVRVTFFQGAPLLIDLKTKPLNDDWLFPLLPNCESQKGAVV
ncbi:hypothetical protein [Vibrio tetraodonis]|uniref:hypothetical protein n=1 Tax=Vibrio tetraodonis TaxID=2231647 RepID=UPI000E0BA66F|nr:hypothetical protein [Vibrio tetraodonis]